MDSSNNSISMIIIALIAIGVILWGFSRAKDYGKLGILAWLQSIVLMAPWLVLLGAVALGIYPNMIVVLMILITSSLAYIYLGNRLRASATQNPTPLPTSPPDISNQSNPVKVTTTEAIPSLPLPIPEEDIKQIQNIFGIDSFFSTETRPYQEGVIFKGNLRGEPDVVYPRLSEKLERLLPNKYRLFLVEGPEGKPVVIIIPRSNDPQPLSLAQKNLAIVLFLATIATIMEMGGILIGFDWFSDLGRYREVLPLATAMGIVLIVHELGHIIAAKYHQVRLSWPFLLPSWQIGSFGAITRFLSLLPNRSVMFDIAIAGPFLGTIVSFILLVTGLLLSHSGSGYEIPSQFFQGSILVAVTARLLLGDVLQSSLIEVHPLVLIGWLGLLVNALNLLPAGQLDGGRIVQAIYGRKIVRRTTVATLIVLGIVTIVNAANPVPLYWGIIILFLQRELERPTLNELSEIDDNRAAIGLFFLLVMLFTLLPLNGILAAKLGIGG